MIDGIRIGPGRDRILRESRIRDRAAMIAHQSHDFGERRGIGWAPVAGVVPVIAVRADREDGFVRMDQCHCARRTRVVPWLTRDRPGKAGDVVFIVQHDDGVVGILAGAAQLDVIGVRRDRLQHDAIHGM